MSTATVPAAPAPDSSSATGAKVKAKVRDKTPVAATAPQAGNAPAPIPPADAAPGPCEFYRAASYRPEESIGYLMKRILATVGQQIEWEMGEGGATFPQWVPLFKLSHGHARTVAELARECQLDAGAMTRLLDRLESKGLCRRVRSVSDRRVVNVELTPAGEEEAQRIPPVLCRVQNDHLAGFSQQDWEQLRALLQRVLGNALRLQAAREAGARQGASDK